MNPYQGLCVDLNDEWLGNPPSITSKLRGEGGYFYVNKIRPLREYLYVKYCNLHLIILLAIINVKYSEIHFS